MEHLTTAFTLNNSYCTQKVRNREKTVTKFEKLLKNESKHQTKHHFLLFHKRLSCCYVDIMNYRIFGKDHGI